MPSTATDRLNGLTTSVAVKPPCRVATTANITLSGLQTINGVALVEDDRVLVKDQATQSQNGIYLASTGDWTRAKDFDGNRDVVQGTRVLVAMPNSAHAAEYEVTTANPIIIDTTSITFVLRYGANATYDRTAAEIAAGVTPTDYAYPPGYLYRYGTNTTPGTTDMATALTNAWAANNGVVEFPEETVLVGSAVTPTISNMLIRGRGGILKIAGSFTNQTNLLNITNLSNISFENIVFDGNLANQGIVDTSDTEQIAINITGTSTNIRITNCHFKDWGKDGVRIGTSTCKRISVRGCRFENIRRAGVVVVAGEQIHVEDNQFFLGKDQSNVVFNNGVHMEANSASDSTRGLIVKGNSFRDMQGGVYLWNAQQADCTGIVVDGNQFDTITNRAAIVAYACALGLTISNNEGRSCGVSVDQIASWGGGVSMSASPYATVEGNTWYQCTGYYGTCVAYGSAGSSGSLGLKVANNTHIADQKRGIYIGFVNGAATTGSLRQIVGNTLLGGGQATANTYAAIEIANSASHNGSGDIIARNQIQISTSSGYNTGVAIDRDDGSSQLGPNLINGATGTRYNVTNGSVSRYPDRSIDVTVTYDPASLGAGADAQDNITVSGVALGDAIEVIPPYDLQGITVTAHARGTNSVGITLRNDTAGTIDLASGSWRFVAKRYT